MTVRYMLMTAAIFIGELFIKMNVDDKWKMGHVKDIAGGRIGLHRYHNKGAMCNLGEKHSMGVAALSVGLTAGLLVYFVLTLFQTGNHGLKTGLALLLGGAFSNTYDRMKRKYVVDYFSFHTGIRMIDRMIFNLADFAILAGAMISVICAE